MKRREFISLLGVAAIVRPLVARAQPSKVVRIGALYIGLADAEQFKKELRDGLRELGYVEGKNIAFEYRSAEGKLDRLPELADELVRMKLDVILTGGNTAIRAAKKATRTIPIVIAHTADPVGDGFAVSLAWPGGNITGLTSSAGYELSGKRLELLKETIPKTDRVAVLRDPANLGTAQSLKETETAARSLKVDVESLEVRNSKVRSRVPSRSRQARRCSYGVGWRLFNSHRSRIVNSAAKSRLPAMY